MILIVPEKIPLSLDRGAIHDHTTFSRGYDLGFNTAIDKIIELNKAANHNGMLVYEGIIKYDEVK